MRRVGFLRRAIRRKGDDFHATTARANQLLVWREIGRLHYRCGNRHAKAQYKRQRHRLNQSARGAAGLKERGKQLHGALILLVAL